MNELRVIISGGGTGGHIFPAVSIANALREINPDVKILFVGANGRMEMQRVPAAGYEIIGLPVRGLLRPLWKPAAYELGIPCLIQEQNSYAGLTNKTLAKKASKICVAYEGMERFFPKDRILLTGNPVRQNLFNDSLTREECAAAFGLNPSKPTILLVGGSLGARTLNESVVKNLSRIAASPVQFIWQTGSYYKKEIEQTIDVKGKPGNIVVTDFISRMDQAYHLADLVISRAGAGTISELCLLGKPSILVPSPNVAEDHQTHNAMALVGRQAALLVRDAVAREELIPLALETVVDANKLQQLGRNAAAMALRDSARIIAEEVIKLAQGAKD